ncbi:hypothetical protein SAMN06265349_10628 [Flavobacterium resistens]|uniref:CarboxypepD_reg-like domain-containing protein n=1 Tax=Flavobacterium resistens TaxID=443612 RepID=A0A521EZK8_9FLAO|nr:carboxypeptidase-like regulatory domain-containing protein [Flavobacterium resistens]MRX69335.1 hypothetical protein [Flavobacterium resistens]SMO89317.1 hypothetical protein SAMN06265349_10628 [Flavobacterium resistens]
MKIFKLGKTYIIILLLNTFQIALSQNKTLFVFDKTTKLPIENAIITYVNLNEGTFTNTEGKSYITSKNSNLKISSLGFEDVVLDIEKMAVSDTVFMIPKVVELDEIVIKSFNLNKALQFVLDNYEKLYVAIPFEKECNFKETVLIDNQLKRLILTKVNWWGKTYKLQNNSDLKLRLGTIDYNKNIPLNIYVDVPRINENKSGYIVPNSLINSIYLNTYLTDFIKYNKNLASTVEQSPADQIIVSFESEWENLKDVSKRSRGKITFDKNTKAILDFATITEFKNNLTKKIIKENQKETTNETKNTAVKLTFYKAANNVLSLKSFEATIEGSITYDNKLHSSVFANSIYVLKETPVNKVDNDGLIDLSKPIYQNLPAKTVTTANSIILNQSETDFIENK